MSLNLINCYCDFAYFLIFYKVFSPCRRGSDEPPQTHWLLACRGFIPFVPTSRRKTHHWCNKAGEMAIKSRPSLLVIISSPGKTFTQCSTQTGSLASPTANASKQATSSTSRKHSPLRALFDKILRLKSGQSQSGGRSKCTPAAYPLSRRCIG